MRPKRIPKKDQFFCVSGHGIRYFSTPLERFVEHKKNASYFKTLQEFMFLHGHKLADGTIKQGVLHSYGLYLIKADLLRELGSQAKAHRYTIKHKTMYVMHLEDDDSRAFVKAGRCRWSDCEVRGLEGRDYHTIIKRTEL